MHSKGRGAGSNPANRYANWSREQADDGWGVPPDESAPKTTLTADSSHSIIARNNSPDIPFDRSINPYRGCEHGCIYCYARPTHAWLGMSPGLDFETQLLHKSDAPELLAKELSKPGYRCAPIALSGNTDAWQPVERQLGITRRILEVLLEFRHPLLIVSKASLIERDLDLLQALAEQDLVRVSLSFTTLDAPLARTLEPRASRPARRLETLATLSEAGIPCGIICAPVIPGLTDSELETLLTQAHSAGARWARYQMIRLPLEVEPLFRQWLEAHYPDRADKVMNRIRDCHGGKIYEPTFGRRMRGDGVFADLIEQRFRVAVRRLGFGEESEPDSSRFRPSSKGPEQLSLGL